MYFPKPVLRLIFLLFPFILLSGAVYAQDASVRIHVVSSKKENLPLATVQLISVADSTYTLSRSTDSAGVALFAALTGGQYKVRVSSVSYLAAEQGIAVKPGQSSVTITLQPESKALSGVVVTASRPLMRQEDDKTIVDPEPLVNSSTNAYEIMEKTPGLFVDQDGNIYLNSTTPATVYINGREQKMSAADVATMLKNLPPNAIASIEILRTPSARYDASGSGGVVNVVLRKGVRIGLTGSVTLGGNQGSYGNQFVGLNLNNNNGALTTYINLQVGSRINYDQIKTDRLLGSATLGQDAFTKYNTDNYYVGYGLNYSFTKKWEGSYDGRLSYSDSRNNSTNLSLIRSLATSSIASSNTANVGNKITNYNLNQGLNLKYKFDSLGSEWTTDLSYTYSPGKTDQLFNTIYTQPSKPTLNGAGDIDTKLQFYSASSNIVKKLGGKITLEAGIKASFVDFNNTTDYFNTVNGTQVPDTFRTRSFKYTENINAAYLQASQNFSGFILKMGTRLENTNMTGHQLTPRDTSFLLDRTDLFPYIYLSRGLMKIAGYELRAYLVYRRTINRPAYEQLNPSRRFIDPYLIETGNPSLRPQFTRNYEANISVDERPIIAIGYNDTRDIFTQVMYQPDTIAFRTYDNLGHNKELYFRALGAIPPGRKYFFVAGVQYNHNLYEGLYENKPLSFERGSWTLFTYHQLKLTPNTQFSMHGFARFKGQMQFYELGSFGSLNMNLTQQFMKRKLAVTVSVNDVFQTNRNEFTLKQGSVSATGFRQGDTRRLGVNIRYNFGFHKKEDNNMFNMDFPEKAGQ